LDAGGFIGIASGYDNYYCWTDPKTGAARTVFLQEHAIIPVSGLSARLNFGVFNITTRLIPNVLSIEGGFRF
jgi:hypothetical protein